MMHRGYDSVRSAFADTDRLPLKKRSILEESRDLSSRAGDFVGVSFV
jgi:hypothetical protein